MNDDRHRLVAWVTAHVMPHEPAVRAWLSRRVVNREEVDDLIQEAYARLAALTCVDRIERPDGYFFQIVRNLLIEQVRRARIVRFETIARTDELALHDDEPSPERIASGRGELARVQQLIEALPERCRRIFILRKVDGLSQREIARRMGVSESVVENEGAKGLRLIMQALRQDGDERETRQVASRKARR